MVRIGCGGSCANPRATCIATTTESSQRQDLRRPNIERVIRGCSYLLVTSYLTGARRSAREKPVFNAGWSRQQQAQVGHGSNNLPVIIVKTNNSLAAPDVSFSGEHGFIGPVPA